MLGCNYWVGFLNSMVVDIGICDEFVFFLGNK